MTDTATSYALNVTYWQHNTGDGRCGQRRRDVAFRSLEAAAAAHWRIQALLQGGRSEGYRRRLEDDLGLDSVTIEGSRIFRIERTPVPESEIPAAVPGPDDEEDVDMDD